MTDRRDYLRRLDRQNYLGEAWVHWSLTIQDRSVGWLRPTFLYRFRELLTHTCFRHRMVCLLYCLMPDHIHMLMHGIDGQTDQLLGMQFVRTKTNESLNRIGVSLQKQAYDRVLRETEVQQTELENIVDYLARNPERAGLVPADGFASYAYTGCLIPGYPELRLFQTDSWPRIWRALSYVKRTDVFRVPDPKRAGN